MTTKSNIIEDMRVLKAYKEGTDVVLADLEKFEELASIGLVKKGIRLKRRKVAAKETALGLRLIKQ
jgi:hypothetical protein